MQHEITRMRAQQDSLKMKIKETTEKYEDEHDIHQKNMAILKRESENQLKRVRELEVCQPSELVIGVLPSGSEVPYLVGPLWCHTFIFKSLTPA